MREYKVKYYAEKDGIVSEEYETISVEATSEREAIDLAMDYLKEQVIQNSDYTADIKKDSVVVSDEFEEKIIGSAEIRKIFTFSKVGKIAGSYVTDGLIKSNSNIRVIRDGIVIHDGKIAGLQRGKDSVKEVKKGFECGITLESYSDLKEGDTLEAYEIVEVKK